MSNMKNANQQTLGEIDNFKEFVHEAQSDIKDLQLRLGVMLVCNGERLDDIPHIKSALRDIRDELSIIKQCLINRGLLDERVL